MTDWLAQILWKNTCTTWWSAIRYDILTQNGKLAAQTHGNIVADREKGTYCAKSNIDFQTIIKLRLL